MRGPANDLRLAIRSLLRRPAFLAAATLSLGLALGLNTTTFAIVDAVLHPHVPFHDPDRLYWVVLSIDGQGGGFNPADSYRTLWDGTDAFEDVAFGTPRRALVQVSTSTEAGWVADVSGNLFALLGVDAREGRHFTGMDRNEPGAVISHRLRQRMVRDRPLAGATVRVDGEPHPVIGVMPRGMREPFGTDVWLLASTAEVAVQARWLITFVRLREDVTREQAQAQLTLMATRLTEEYGTGQQRFRYGMRSIQRDSEGLRLIHRILLGAAAVILVIACANLANLMLARGITVGNELAVRRALGATRGRLVSQLLAEATIVAVVGGAVGTLLSIWGGELLENRLPPDAGLGSWLVPQFSWRVLAFGVAVTMATVVIFGLLPAIRASGVDVTGPLKDRAGTTTPRTRARYSVLVVAQVALSVVLLTAAALLANAAQRVSAYDFGYDSEGLLTASIWSGSGPRISPDSAARVHAAVLQRAGTIPGVRAAATYGGQLLGQMVSSDDPSGVPFYKRGHWTVSADFLRTLGIPLVEGRDFLPGDEQRGGVAIVDEEAARRLWPHGSAVDRMIRFGDPSSPGSWLRVVGVARQVSFGLPHPLLPPEPVIYVLSMQARWTQVVVRAERDEASVALALRREINALLPGTGSRLVSSWGRWHERRAASRQFVARLVMVFAGFAVTLLAVGLYSVLAYATNRRMREFGVRIAVGARPRHVLNLVLHDGVAMILAGTGIGALASVWTAEILGAYLYQVDPSDAITLASAETVLFVVCLAACLLPALRAMRADPVKVLRAT